jgi:hypothetical protein
MTIFQANGFYGCGTSRLEGKPYIEEIFMAVFEFIGQFFFQNIVFKLQEVFSEHGIRVFIENGL